MPLTAYSYPAMTNQRVAQSTWNKEENIPNHIKQKQAGYSVGSLFSYDKATPSNGQNQNSRTDSGFFDQISFGDKLGLNNSCGSDKFSGKNFLRQFFVLFRVFGVLA